TPVFSWPWWRKIFNLIHYIVIFLETIQYNSRMHRRVIAISHQVKGDLIDHYGMESKNIDVVQHGVNIIEFSPNVLSDARGSIRAELGIDANAIVVIFVAHEFMSDALHDSRLGDLLTLLHDASVRAQPDDELPVVRPSGLGRVMFRQMIAQLLRHDTEVTARKGIVGRIGLIAPQMSLHFPLAMRLLAW
ncbi:MAG: hypothetical protein NTV34_04415, partial [Proteobacteria bacterium]|nr:hypothetical protein [Pseudomonadota bacterium]